MQELRLQLAAARADLRSARDDYELIKAQAEQRAKDAANGDLGKNEKDRDRALIIALARDTEYTGALNSLRRAESEVERLDALLEGARDARRYDEWTVRARLIDALVSADIPSNSNDPAGDAAFDDMMLYRIDHMATATIQPQPTQFAVPSARGGHWYIAHRNCRIPNCNICDGGLAHCVVCGGAECELPSDCPGKTMTPDQREAICAGRLDYRAGQWVQVARYKQDQTVDLPF